MIGSRLRVWDSEKLPSTRTETPYERTKSDSVHRSTARLANSLSLRHSPVSMTTGVDDWHHVRHIR